MGRCNLIIKWIQILLGEDVADVDEYWLNIIETSGVRLMCSIFTSNV
ncbi:MAG: hypothetical protein ACPL7I_06875 [Myxococcota bacterium]